MTRCHLQGIAKRLNTRSTQKEECAMITKFQYWIFVLALMWVASACEALATTVYVPPPTYLFGRLDLAAGGSP